MCLLRGDETGIDGSDDAKRGAGEDDIPGRMPAGAVQLCMRGILASAILAIAAAGAAPDELETLLRAVSSPRNKHKRTRLPNPASARRHPDAPMSICALHPHRAGYASSDFAFSTALAASGAYPWAPISSA